MDYSTMICLAELIHEGFLQVLLLFIKSMKNVQKFFRILGTLNQRREFLENADPAFANSRYVFVGDTRGFLSCCCILNCKCFM